MYAAQIKYKMEASIRVSKILKNLATEPDTPKHIYNNNIYNI